MTAVDTSSPRDAAPADLPVLEVRGLSVAFATADGWLPVVEDVTFDVQRGQVVGLVGESGSGKTVTSLALMGLIHRRAARLDGSVRFDDRELTTLSAEQMRRVRGAQMSMIFQEPMTSLNPAFTVGNQIAETVRVHRGGTRKQAWARAIEMLDYVGIPDAARRAKDYPHAFSGGMRQRAMIAMALSCDPKLLVADEPTTALDVTIQAQILELLRSLQRDLDMAVIFVTHDLGVVADICDRVVVMYAGQVVEQADVHALYRAPLHPYSEGLLESMPQVAARGAHLTVIPGQVPRPDAMPAGCRFHPRCRYAEARCEESAIELRSVARGDGRISGSVAGSASGSGAGAGIGVAATAGDAASAVGMTRCVRQPGLALAGTRWQAPAPVAGEREAHARAEPLLEVRGLAKAFPVHSGVLRRVIGHVRAVDGIDFTVAPGETLGLVGESGSGKSTAARLVLQLVEPTAGQITLTGRDLIGIDPKALRSARRDMQIVFQDPYSSLDPRSTIAESVGEPLEVHEGVDRQVRDERVGALLEQVGLGRHLASRYPHEFSGGQRQRIAIARALALNPKLVILDEPVSSLDVSTQSQVINLLMDLQSSLGIAYLFIAHDLSVVRHISARIAVMYLGRIVEIGEADAVYTTPRHPYTEALLSAIPVPDPAVQRSRRRIVLEGDIPSPLNPPSGCRFHTRCPYAMPVCSTVDPEPFVTPDGTTVFCHLHTDGPRLGGEPVQILATRAGAGHAVGGIGPSHDADRATGTR